MQKKTPAVLPGFGLSLGYTVFYLSFLVLIPLSMLFFKTASMGWGQFFAVVTTPRALAAYRLSISASLMAATINAIFGLLVAWVLVRYHFPGRRLFDALIDLPFALPTAVGGIALTALYAEGGWFGSALSVFGLKIAFAPLGVVVALTFIGLPFVVRTIEPVLQELDHEMEEAATTLGASRLQIFWRVLFPSIWPALLTGFTMSFARALGEYGSVVFISGNLPLKTEIAPLLIMTKLEQFDYEGAAAIALVMLTISFVLLLLINRLQGLSQRASREEA